MPSSTRMIAPTMAVLSPPANSPMMKPASSHTTRNSATRRMLFRLLCAIWWYIYFTLASRAFWPRHRLFHASGRPPAPDLRPHEPVAEGGHVFGVMLEVIGPHRSVPLVGHLP